MDDKDYSLRVTNENNETFEIEVIDIISLQEFNREYIIYTLGEIDKNNNQKIYASILEEKDATFTLKTIESEQEWIIIQEKIKNIFEE